MAFTVYKSTDGSAPSLTGQVGSLITLLDACLVNGYGAKAAAGWSKSYSGTNKAVYRAPSGAQMYYRVQDDAPATAKEARLTGYETMSDVDTGTGPFPTAAQGVGGVAMMVIRKSASADATARAWTLLADARTVYFLPSTGDTAGSYLAIGFGEFYSLLPGDAYNGFVCGRSAENSTSTTANQLEYLSSQVTGGSQFFVPRAHTGTGGSVQMSRGGDYPKQDGSLMINGVVPYTNPSDGGIYLCKIRIGDYTTAPVNGIRGRMRGIWQTLHPVASFTDDDTFSGTGSFAGRTFLVKKAMYRSGSSYTFETSDTLETN